MSRRTRPQTGRDSVASPENDRLLPSSLRLPLPASRLRSRCELLKPMLNNDEPVRRIRFEPANHQKPFVVGTDRVLRAVLVRLERGRGKKSGSQYAVGPDDKR